MDDMFMVILFLLCWLYVILSQQLCMALNMFLLVHEWIMCL